MNRVMPGKGTTRAQANSPQTEADQAQQQRFEQAMRLEHAQKAAPQQRGDSPRQMQKPLPQQLLQTQRQKKQAADTARQHAISASHGGQPKQFQPQPFISGEASGLSDSAISEVTARDQREVESKKSPRTLDAQDKEHEVGARSVGLPTPETPFSAPSSMVNTPTPRPPLVGTRESAPESDLATLPSVVKEQTEQEGDGTQQHDMQSTGIAAGAELLSGAAQAALQQGETSLPEDVEFAERLASGADTGTNAITVADEMPEPNGQTPIPPLKTPGDLQLARMAPAENNRELGQLLERLAVDIYQELGRPERPPLLRLTLPELGDLSIRIAHQHGELQIEILATGEGQLLLNQGRGDLVDRLQRLYPGERVSLDLFSQADSEQGSRHKRSIYEEWDADA
ncbi:AscP protein [Aeromonas salmonicida]|jgi:type III secretion protein P|uniref:type III secretion system needle length determinant n=2 Tax=Aeromonas salmonicida TaxID=645 RepID=UPI001025F45F|nr:AscP protein [Aeromonas salmonicida]